MQLAERIRSKSVDEDKQNGFYVDFDVEELEEVCPATRRSRRQSRRREYMDTCTVSWIASDHDQFGRSARRRDLVQISGLRGRAFRDVSVPENCSLQRRRNGSGLRISLSGSAASSAPMIARFI